MSAFKPVSVGFLLGAFVVWLGHPVSSASRGTKSKGHDAAMSSMGREAPRTAVFPARSSRMPASA
jgi:hypothetical protein